MFQLIKWVMDLRGPIITCNFPSLKLLEFIHHHVTFHHSNYWIYWSPSLSGPSHASRYINLTLILIFWVEIINTVLNLGVHTNDSHDCTWISISWVEWEDNYNISALFNPKTGYKKILNIIGLQRIFFKIMFYSNFHQTFLSITTLLNCPSAQKY